MRALEVNELLVNEMETNFDLRGITALVQGTVITATSSHVAAEAKVELGHGRAIGQESDEDVADHDQIVLTEVGDVHRARVDFVKGAVKVLHVTETFGILRTRIRVGAEMALETTTISR